MNQPITTLFLLISVDGKISTGSTGILDVDKDFPKIGGIKEGLQQYYEIEKNTDLHSLNSGKVLAKAGANKPQKNLVKLPVSFLIIDNEPHLNIFKEKDFLAMKNSNELTVGSEAIKNNILLHGVELYYELLQ